MNSSMSKALPLPRMSCAEKGFRVRVVQGGLEYLRGDGVFGTQVDVPLRRAGGQARDGHPFNQAVGIALHENPIREGAGVALVGVADDVLLLAGRIEHGAPLDVGGETSTAAAAQSRGLDLVDHRRGIAG